MKKLSLCCFIFLLSVITNAFAISVHSYQELASAMQAGNRFVILANLQECTGKPYLPIGYFVPSKMMLVPASDLGSERIVTSDLHFTDHTGHPTYEYIKYTFNSDNSVIIHTVIYDPLTFKAINAHVINSILNQGINIHTTTD